MSRYDLQTVGITDVLRACRIHVATGAVDHVLMTQSMPEATRVERAAGGRLNRVVSAKHRFYFFLDFQQVKRPRDDRRGAECGKESDDTYRPPVTRAVAVTH